MTNKQILDELRGKGITRLEIEASCDFSQWLKSSVEAYNDESHDDLWSNDLCERYEDEILAWLGPVIERQLHDDYTNADVYTTIRVQTGEVEISGTQYISIEEEINSDEHFLADATEDVE